MQNNGKYSVAKNHGTDIRHLSINNTFICTWQEATNRISPAQNRHHLLQCTSSISLGSRLLLATMSLGASFQTIVKSLFSVLTVEWGFAQAIYSRMLQIEKSNEFKYSEIAGKWPGRWTYVHLDGVKKIFATHPAFLRSYEMAQSCWKVHTFSPICCRAQAKPYFTSSHDSRVLGSWLLWVLRKDFQPGFVLTNTCFDFCRLDIILSLPVVASPWTTPCHFSFFQSDRIFSNYLWRWQFLFENA